MTTLDIFRPRTQAQPYPAALSAIAAAALAITLVPLAPANATENGLSQYAGGSAQFYGAAMPPFPGLYALSQTNYYSASRTNDGDGDEIPIDIEVQSVSEVLRFLYVSDVNIAGATLWGQLIVPLVNVDLEVVPFVDEEDFALADVIFAGGLAWHVGPHTFVAGTDVATPTGEYDVASPLNIGTNHWSVQPTVGYKYFDPKGFEMSVVSRFIFNFENTATDYQSGTEFYTDYAIGYNIGKFKVGAVGYFYQQISDDEENGIKVGTDGNRGAAFALGPSLTYAVHPGLQFSGSWQHEFYAEHRTQGESFWFNIATKF